MSIKQNGGVFGRNPTFNDVTIEGTLTFDGDIDINSDLKVDGDLDVTGSSSVLGSMAIGSGTPSVKFHVNGGTANQIGLFESTDATVKIGFKDSATTNNYSVTIGAIGDEMTFSSGSGGTERIRVNSVGNVTVSTGNLVIGTSGKGIDFSATAGTGTSELLDDYEEGSWTPVVTGSSSAGTGTYGNQIGLYTKVGRVVHFQCWLQVSAHTGTGVTLINGLPFTSNASDAKGTANLNYFANLTISASNTAGLQVANGQTYLVLKEFPVGGGVAGSVAIDPNMQINFSGSYTV